MAVSQQTATDPDRAGPSPSQRHRPVRTCIGCRTRAAAAELLRVVAAGDTTVVPDPRRRVPGRGAWLHCDPECVERAERRRAFERALRMAGPVDSLAVRDYVRRLGTATSGTPQE